MPKRSFDDLVKLMTTLRGPNGCPWDRKQSLPDLKPFVIEEAYEVVDAIDRDNRAALMEEIGDLLLESVFIAEITRVSPKTPIALCLETPEMWTLFEDQLNQTAEEYVCVCGPYCTPGNHQFRCRETNLPFLPESRVLSAKRRA